MIDMVVALQGVPAPVPPAITPQNRTAPIVEAACKLADARGGQHELTLRQTGGRGYRAFQKDGSPFYPRTPLKQQVIVDTAGIFDGMGFQMDAHTWPGRIEAWKQGGPFARMETMETGHPDRFAVTIRDVHYFVQYVGFCDVKKTQQAPLSDAEAEKVSKQ